MYKQPNLLTFTVLLIVRSGLRSGPTMRNFLVIVSEPASKFNMAVKSRGRPLRTKGLFAVLNCRKISTVSLGLEPGRFSTKPKGMLNDVTFGREIVGGSCTIKPFPCLT